MQERLILFTSRPTGKGMSHHTIQASQRLLEQCQRRQGTVPPCCFATLYVYLSILGGVGGDLHYRADIPQVSSAGMGC